MTGYRKKKKHPRSLFYRISAWLHLWLGLISGMVIVIVSLTGAILTFEQELRLLFQPYQKAEANHLPFLPPSALSKVVMETYKFPTVAGVFYQGEGRSAIVPYYGDPKRYTVVYVDPYSGKILHHQLLDEDFYRIMLTGHYQLWLPRPVGQPIVAYATLIFVITLISGMVLWWPKKWTKSTRKASFFIKVKAKFKRVNYDLHNVLGFYSLLIALVLALTGMVYGMKWFSTAVYFVGSGGEKQLSRRDRAVSDTTLATIHNLPEEDILFHHLVTTGVDLDHQLISISYPFGKKGAWGVGINPKPGTSYLDHYQYYEQHSLKLLPSPDLYAKANGGEKISRLNLDLHIGAIGGIWTKIIAFLVCVICTSLPITGFIIWIRKRNKFQF
ncbi:PepSY domain-containing protein [Pedobacter sp. L105]|uniref:PepSY-associated TM helix domain-containing protein n=1 Tax=Pedobacter sp. L105 TaxID=1641871 RepID=UPI00131A6923|nr:PepSY-associated TM helix domain-containing protein [Pedobacter sp. L105]